MEAIPPAQIESPDDWGPSQDLGYNLLDPKPEVISLATQVLI